MNRKQREQNKANARMLANNAVICPECGERGKHYVVDPAPWFGGDCGGFWTCAKFYGADGRRLAEASNVEVSSRADHLATENPAVARSAAP